MRQSNHTGTILNVNGEKTSHSKNRNCLIAQEEKKKAKTTYMTSARDITYNENTDRTPTVTPR